MKLIRTVIAFVLGIAVGYALKAWDVELPEEVRTYAAKIESYADDIEKMGKEKEKLEAEVKRLQQKLGGK